MARDNYYNPNAKLETIYQYRITDDSGCTTEQFIPGEIVNEFKRDYPTWIFERTGFIY